MPGTIVPNPRRLQYHPKNTRCGGGKTMGFVQAIKSAYSNSNYAKFSGRASRSEYLWFCLLWVGMLVGSSLAGYILERYSLLPYVSYETGNGPITIFDVAIIVFWLISILPYAAVSSRRLHDLGQSGFWCIITIHIPGILFSRGTAGDNRFGPTEMQHLSNDATQSPLPVHSVSTNFRAQPQKIALSLTPAGEIQNSRRSQSFFARLMKSLNASIDRRRGLFRVWIVFTTMWIAACAAYGAAFERQFENTAKYTVDVGFGPTAVIAAAGLTENEVGILAEEQFRPNDKYDCLSQGAPDSQYLSEDACVLPHKPNFWPLVFFAAGGSIFALAFLVGGVWAAAGFKHQIN